MIGQRIGRIKTKRLCFIAINLAISVIVACAGSTGIDAEDAVEQFPESRFLTADGLGETEAEAKRAAMAELAAVFETTVYAQTIQRAESWLADDLPERFDKQVAQTVHLQTNVLLKGARIGRIQKDADGGGFRALAVLDRRQAASQWQREMEAIEAAIDGQVAVLRTTEGRLSRLTVLNRLAESMVRQAVIESRLSVLGYPSLSAIDDYADFLLERRQLAHDVVLWVQIEGQQERSFKRRVIALLSDGGYAIAPKREAAVGLITGYLDLQSLDLGNPDVYFVRAVADVLLVDMDTGNPIASFDENQRKGHVNADEAARRAVAALAGQVADKLMHSLGTVGVGAK
jgi:hypothetical protein